jgi:hypothetical protein
MLVKHTSNVSPYGIRHIKLLSPTQVRAVTAMPSMHRLCYQGKFAPMDDISREHWCDCYGWYILFGSCLSQGFYCCDKIPWPKIKLRRNGFVQLTFPHCCSSAKEVRIGTKPGQKPGGRSWYKARPWRGAAYCFASPGLFGLLFIKPSTTSPGMAPPTMGWALSFQSLIKKILYSQILWRHFLN